MRSTSNKNCFNGVAIVVLMALSNFAFANCGITSVQGQSGCPGQYTLSATSMVPGVTSHKWYTAQTNGSGITVTNQFSPNTGVWVSQVVQSFSQTTTYWVAAVCNGQESARTAVTFTVSSGSTISISHTPVGDPLDFCEGSNATMTATGGSNYQWRRNSPTGTILSTASSYTTNVSGTYYLTGTNSCGTSQTPTYQLLFKPNLGAISLSSGANFCQGSQTTTVFTGSASNASAYSWAVTGTGNTVSSGVVTWNPFFSGSATVTLTAHGCNDTQVSASTSVSVYPLPDVTITPSSNPVIPFGQNSITISCPANVSHQWYYEGKVLPGQVSNSLQVYFPGLYRVAVTDANQCASNSAAINVTVENNQNYVLSNSLLVDTKSDATPVNENDMFTLNADQRIMSVTYFDALGRPLQKVIREGTPSKKDLIQPIAYDNFDREIKKYLPYAGTQSNGFLRINPVGTTSYTGSEHESFYKNGTGDFIADDPQPYGETVYEAANLNRPSKQYGPGRDWSYVTGGNNKFVEHRYLTNLHSSTGTETAEKVIAWRVNATSGMPERAPAVTGVITAQGCYDSNQLLIHELKDEAGNSVREYVNKSGKTVLRKTQVVAGSTDLNNTAHWALTYYIYDETLNLSYVFQPELSSKIQTDSYVPTSDDLNNLAYQYKYDSRKRMSEKKLPGAGWVYMVYDKWDRLVLIQDANQRAGITKYWTFTKYDLLNRPIATGIKDTAADLSQSAMQNAVNTFYSTKVWALQGERYIGHTAAGNVHGYSNRSYPVVTTIANDIAVVKAENYLTVTYYDNYNYRAGWVGAYAYTSHGLSDVSPAGITYTQLTAGNENIRLNGKVTGTKSKVLDAADNSGASWIRSIMYYDSKYRVIQTISDNYKGGTDRTSQLYDFAGRLMKSKLSHVQRDVTWKDLSGVSQTGTVLRNVLASGAAGAASEQVLAASTNGWMEVVFSEAPGIRLIGLNDSNQGVSSSNINYAFKFVGSTVYVIENTTTKATISPVQTGEIFKIDRTGSTVKFYRNNQQITLSSAAASFTGALIVDTYLEDPGGTIAGVRSSFGSSTSEIEQRNETDHAGRILSIDHDLNGNNIKLVHNSYNEVGQLIDKKLHSVSGSPFRQSADYRYNIRGWLTSINNASLTSDAGVTNDETTDYFGMNLSYNTIDSDLNNSKMFGGNISAIKWSNFPGTGTIKQKGYVYSYDALNRLTSSSFREKTSGWATLLNSRFAESGLVYDLNGNIKSLTRNDKRASGTMDILTYDYGSSGNQLQSVTDAGDVTSGFLDGNTANADYAYDGNGNMVADNNGEISQITYNLLNLPKTVTKGSNTVQYIHDASGRKHAQVVTYNLVQKQTDYSTPFHYENDRLESVLHNEGRILMNKVEHIYYHHADVSSDVTGSGVTFSTTTNPAGEKYVKATSTGTIARSGITSIGSSVIVSAGERYRIRIKAYRHKGTAVGSNEAFISLKGNGTDLAWPGSRIPQGMGAEAYVEQLVTIPVGVSLLTIGVNWGSTLSVGEVIYFNDLEVIRESSQAPEYQYNLTDHLGSVRVTFTTKEELVCDLATLETANANAEQGKFLYYDEAIKINHVNFDHTYDGTTGATTYATRLSGANTNARYGLAKSLSVMPGDVINAEVYAKYIDTNTANWTTAFGSFMAAVANGTAPAGTLVDGGAPGSTGGASLPFGAIDHSAETGVPPKAYLNYVVYNKDLTTVLDLGFSRITTNSREYGQNVAHDKLEAQITIKEPGFVYIYLSNDNPTIVDVMFDDFKVCVTKSPIIQMNDYYAYGMTFNSYQRENSVANQFLFNGKENQDEMNLGWLDYGARMYLPETARWNKIDSRAHNYMKFSPYGYVAGNPVNNVDYNGDFILPKGFLNRFQRIAQYLANDIQGILNNKKIVNALIKHSGYSAKELKKIFTWGQGPVLSAHKFEGEKYSELGRTYALYRKHDDGSETYVPGSAEIVINIDLFEDLETATGKDRDYILFLTAVTILHELVHHGFHENQLKTKTEEEGNDFENDAYGQVVRRANYKEVMDKWINKKFRTDEPTGRAIDFFDQSNGPFLAASSAEGTSSNSKSKKVQSPYHPHKFKQDW